MNKIFIIVLLSTSLSAIEETFVREYTYQASDYDSKVTSRVNALEQVKRLLLEEVSVFILSEVDWTQKETIIDGKYTMKDVYEQNIKTITAGITETIIIDERWTGDTYWLKANITLDTNDIKNKIEAIINNKDTLEELEEVKKKADNALVEIDRLKKELKKTKSELEHQRLTKAYNIESNALSSIDLFYKGYKSINNENYDKAIAYYLQAIELEPYFIYMYYHNLGAAYAKQSNWTKAISYFEKTINLKSDYYLSYFNIGLCYNNTDNYTKAISYFKKSINIKPDYSEAYHELGVAYVSQTDRIKAKADRNKAIKSFQKAIKLNPYNANTHFRLGLQYGLQGNYENAISSLEQALKLESDNTEILFNLGLIYRMNGKYIKAIQNFEKATNLEDYRGYEQIAVAYGFLKKDDEAIKYYKKAIEFYPDNDFLHYGLGVAYATKEGIDSYHAIKSLKRAAQLGSREAQKFLKDNGYEY